MLSLFNKILFIFLLCQLYSLIVFSWSTSCRRVKKFCATSVTVKNYADFCLKLHSYFGLIQTWENQFSVKVRFTHGILWSADERQENSISNSSSSNKGGLWFVQCGRRFQSFRNNGRTVCAKILSALLACESVLCLRTNAKQRTRVHRLLRCSDR